MEMSTKMNKEAIILEFRNCSFQGLRMYDISMVFQNLCCLCSEDYDDVVMANWD